MEVGVQGGDFVIDKSIATFAQTTGTLKLRSSNGDLEFEAAGASGGQIKINGGLSGTDILIHSGTKWISISTGGTIQLYGTTSNQAIRTQQSGGRNNITFIIDVDGSFFCGR